MLPASHSNADGAAPLIALSDSTAWYALEGADVVISRSSSCVRKAYFTLPTLPDSDNGAPHALEHMIFAGSDLDECAPYFLGGPTNAWTLEDHTCYQLRCACAEGFCKLIKVYLHALMVVDVSTAFDTEVAGVVFSEIMADESSDTDLMRDLAKHLYRSLPYSYDAGGSPAGLRTLTPEVLTRFHKEHYSKRMLIFLETSDPHEMLIRALRSSPLVTRPKPRHLQVGSCWPFPSGVHTVSCLRKEEETGLVVAAWKLPPWKDQLHLAASSAIFAHLTSGANGSLYDALVQGKETCLSVDVMQQEYGCYSALILLCGGVPAGAMKDFAAGLHEKVKEALGKLPLDKQDLLRPAILSAKREAYAQSDLSSACRLIGAFLYADNMKTAFVDAISAGTHLEQISSKWSAVDWESFIESTFVQLTPFVLYGELSNKNDEEQPVVADRNLPTRQSKRLRRHDPTSSECLGMGGEYAEELLPLKIAPGVFFAEVTGDHFAHITVVLPFQDHFREAALWASAAMSLPVSGAGGRTAWQALFGPLSFQGKLSSISVRYGDQDTMAHGLFFETCAPSRFAAEVIEALTLLISKQEWDDEQIKKVARQTSSTWANTTFEDGSLLAGYALEWSLYRDNDAVKAQNPICMNSWMRSVGMLGCPSMEGLYEKAGGIQVLVGGGAKASDLVLHGDLAVSDCPVCAPLVPGFDDKGCSAVIIGVPRVSTHAVKVVAKAAADTPGAVFLIWAEVLKRPEGSLWKAVRGSGSAYGFAVDYQHSDATLRFEVTEAAANPATSVRQLLDMVMSPPAQITAEDFNIAKGAALLQAAENLDTREAQVQASFERALSTSPPLTKADVKAVSFASFTPACTPDCYRMAWSCPLAAVTEAKESAAGMGFSIEFANNLADFLEFVVEA